MSGDVKRCGAQTRSGKACSHERGWGTDHPGYGRCKMHGGSSPAGKQAAARERALETGRRFVEEVDVDPARALLSAVRLHAGIRQTYLEQLADAAEPGPVLAELRATNRELALIAKAAADAGVNERLVRMAERHAAMLSAALEDALAVLGELLTPALRSKVVATYVARLEVLESTADELDETPALPAAA